MRLTLVQWSRSLEPWLVTVIVIGNANLMLRDPSAEALWFAIGVIVLVHLGMITNLFGNDGPGFDRVLLWPVAPSSLFYSKNAALGLQIAVPIAFLAILSSITLHSMMFAHGFFQAATTFLGLSAFGNRASVDARVPRGFLPAHGLTPLQLLMSIGFGFLVFLVTLISWREFGAFSLAVSMAMAILAAFVWRRSLQTAPIEFGQPDEPDG